MENSEVAAALDELAARLRLEGANPYRVRAYRRAARTVESLGRRLEDMVAAGEPLTSLPGIGKDMERHILELLETGAHRRLAEMRDAVPAAVLELVGVSGLGPKRAHALWEALRVDSVDALEAAIREGRVDALPGFGAKTSARLLTAIERRRSEGGRHLRAAALGVAEALAEWVRAAPGVRRVEVAGALRRRASMVDEAVLVAAADGEPDDTLRHFAGFAGAVASEVGVEGEARLTLRSGLRARLVVSAPERFGTALLVATGSERHVARLGLDASAAHPTEESAYGALGLPLIPPELREDRGEVDAAAAGHIPRLVDLADLRGDLQMHSTWSDGRQSIEKMATACRALGLEYLAITDHSQSLTITGGLTPERVRLQWAEIERVRESVEGIRLLRGLEVDILRDGSLDMPDDVLEGLDIVVVSVHSFMRMEGGEMTERVIRALRHPLVDVLAHPTGRLLGRRPAYDLDVDAVLEAAAELDVAVELNASPDRLDFCDVHVRRAAELGVKVVISTDAHSVKGLSTMRYGVDEARRGWLAASDVVNAMPWPDFEAWLNRKTERT